MYNGQQVAFASSESPMGTSQKMDSVHCLLIVLLQTPAEEIYVVLGDQKRVSRYFRADWLIRQYVQSRQSQQKLRDEFDQVGTL